MSILTNCSGTMHGGTDQDSIASECGSVDVGKDTGNAITTEADNTFPIEEAPEVLLEGWMLKQSRNNFWQDRYFVFQTDQTLSYRRKKDDGKPRWTFRISRESGCEISDLYVEQRSAHHSQHPHESQHGTSSSGSKESLYCVTISWPDETETGTSYTMKSASHNDSFRDDSSYQGGLAIINNNSSSQLLSDGHRPDSPGPRDNTRSHRLWRSPKMSRLKKQRSDGSVIPAEDSSLGSHPSPGGPRRRPSFLRRRQKLGNSASNVFAQQKMDSTPLTKYHTTNGNLNNSINMDDESINSLLDPPKRVRRRVKDSESPSPVLSMIDRSMPNIKFNETIKESSIMKRQSSNVPIMEVQVDDVNGSNLLLSPRVEGDELDELLNTEEVDLSDVEGSKNNCKEHDEIAQTERMSNLRQTLSEENGVEKRPSYEERNVMEQEKLHHEFLSKQRKKRSDTTKRVVGATKIAVAASAAIGVGIVTAGVLPLAAGLVFLGGAAALGGTAGVAEVGLKRSLKRKDQLTIASTNYEVAKLWKSTLEACLEQETFKQSTWGQLFAADGRKTASAFKPDIKNAHSEDDDDDPGVSIAASYARISPKELPKGQAKLFLKDPNFFAQSRVRWRPLDGGWVSFLGPGAQSLRIFKEERVTAAERSKMVAPLAVGGATSTPLRTQVVLNAHPTEAFMCIMSYARIVSDSGDVSPNSGQSASYRLVEKIDDHTDVLHLVCRPLYLFPSWTEARDFVLLRYWRYEPDGSYIICFESTEHEFVPPKPGFVRGEMHQVYTIAPPKTKEHQQHKGVFSGGSECMLNTVVQVDPKGWVPTTPIVFLSNQTYADAFGISALLQTLDIRDAILSDQFLNLSPDLYHSTPATGKNGQTSHVPQEEFDMRFVNRERCDSYTIEKFPNIGSFPPPIGPEGCAEPDANSFMVRGATYKRDGIKVNAGTSIGQLVAMDIVRVDKPIYGGMSTHPTERIQLALKREKMLKEKGRASDVPPFMFVVNIMLPGPPFYHGVFYFAVDDMSTIDGSDGTPSSRICNRFLFGDSDKFRDQTFKLIPHIVEGNFLVRKAVGSTPAIMGSKLKQYYVRTDRFMEVILDCGSSAVATGVIRLSLGYAKTLVVDMAFLLEGDKDEYLPERIFGAVRVKYPSFGTHCRKVEQPRKEH